MTIRKHEDRLFARLHQKYDFIVSDGMLDESRYANTEPRILFILKEANDPEPTQSWDLRWHLQNRQITGTYVGIARWIYGMNNLDRDVPWEEVHGLGNEQMKQQLVTAAVMNVKKTPGKATSKEAELKAWAVDNADTLRAQFNLYEPDIVICCGYSTSRVAQAAKIIEPAEKKRTSRGVWTMKTTAGTQWITFHHPEAHVPDHLLYYGLIDAVKEILR